MLYHPFAIPLSCLFVEHNYMNNNSLSTMSTTGKSDSRKHKKKDKKDHHKSSSSSKHKKESKKDSHIHKKRKEKDKDRDKERVRDREKDGRHSDHKSLKKTSHAPRDDIAPITEDDYFLKNEEFRVWLHVTRDTAFETLNTVDARELFSGRFCKDWNSGTLASMFYEGTIPTELRQQCGKTAHKWRIKLSVTEKEQVSDLAYRVDTSTRKQFSNAWTHMAKDTSASGDTRPSIDNARPFSSSSSGATAALDKREKRSLNGGDEQARREEQQHEEQIDRKRQRYHEREKAKVILDEIAPKATGRDAQIDKKRAVSAKLQGAAADREGGRDGMELSEDVTMGGGDDFESARARVLQGKQRKMNQKQDRIRELQVKEQDKNQNFMNQLGIDFSKGPIKIQPR